MTALADHQSALTLCTYCPSLCLHACPVWAVTARDSASPWGMMSLAGHVDRKRVTLSPEVARVFYQCVGCGGCTDACLHHNDVEGALLAARRDAVAADASPFPRTRFRRPDASLSEGTFDCARTEGRYNPEASVLLLPGSRMLVECPEFVDVFCQICERLQDDEVCLGDAARLDVGYELWASGYQREFLAQAARVSQALSRARQVVVPSPEVLFTLKHVYPRYGHAVRAELLHSSEYLLPTLSGAIIERLDERVGYHASCHLSRHLGVVEAPDEILRRLLAEPPIEIGLHQGSTTCCGATGCYPTTHAEMSVAVARRLVDLALERGVDRLVSFSPECVVALREAAGDHLLVDHAVTLVDQAVRGD